MEATVTSKGEIVLPDELRPRDGIEPGQVFELERISHGEYRMTRLPAAQSSGVIDWLKACPEQGFFRSVASESTDTR